MSGLDTALAGELDTIRAIPDPAERARAAIALVEWMRTVAMPDAVAVRTAAVRTMYHQEGLTLQQVGNALGLTHQRVQQLVSGVSARSRR